MVIKGCYVSKNQHTYLKPRFQASSYEPVRLSVNICLRPAAMSAMLVPDQQAGMHSCTRQSGSYVAVAPDQQSFLYVA